MLFPPGTLFFIIEIHNKNIQIRFLNRKFNQPSGCQIYCIQIQSSDKNFLRNLTAVINIAANDMKRQEVLKAV